MNASQQIANPLQPTGDTTPQIRPCPAAVEAARTYMLFTIGETQPTPQMRVALAKFIADAEVAA